MTDTELLELAAKAAGIKHNPSLSAACRGERIWWNPLTDDGDALRLAVKLKIHTHTGFGTSVLDAPDPYAATRRTIVRAAAEIGKEIK